MNYVGLSDWIDYSFVVKNPENMTVTFGLKYRHITKTWREIDSKDLFSNQCTVE